MAQTKDVVETLENWLDDQLFDVHTMIPGQILNYEGHTTRKATVQPQVKLRNRFNKIVDIQPITDVPVMFPSSSNFNMLFPLNRGDGVLLLFAESGIGNFLNSTNEIVDADDLNRFELTDCIAIPGLWSFKNTPIVTVNDNDFYISYQNSKIQIVKDTGEIIIENAAGKVKITAAGEFIMLDGTEPMVLGTVFDTWVTSILLTLYNAHTHSIPAGGSTNPPSVPLTPPINYLSTLIKGK